MTNPVLGSNVGLWLAEPLPREVVAPLQRLAATDDVVRVAVMPDVHLAEDVCIGTIVATRSRLFPAAVGGDIGCGMAAIRLHSEATALADERTAATILAGLYRLVPTVKHDVATLPEVLSAGALGHASLEKLKERDGRLEFATLGRGNHFIEFQADDDGALWLMLHSGSRAMGQAIRDHHLRSTEMNSTGLRYLDADREQGRAYLSDLQWALTYADLSRRAMVEVIARFVEERFQWVPDWSTYLACNHNHVRREEHDGESLWVHRKGAISARAGEPGIVPGSMGTESFHVEGRGVGASLASTLHGAGRTMSRTDARRRISVRTFEREVEGVWYDHRLAARLRDESPSAYKDIRGVMRAQQELTRVLRRLRPVLSYKGV